MKKLIILSGVLLLTFAVNAASYNWSVKASNVYTTIDNSSYSKLTGDIYLFIDGFTGTAGTSGTLSEGAVAKIAVTSGSSSTTVFAIDGFNDDPDVALAETYDFYFKIINDDYVYTSHVMADVKAAEGESGTQVVFGNMGGSSTSATWAQSTRNEANWSPVPEPTSGLLLLCGLAGLALRRKRA